MTPAQTPSLSEELAAALAWWREAGVDRVYRDKAAGWLADPADEAAGDEPGPEANSPSKAAPAPEPQARIGGEKASWPARLGDFAQWWLTEPTLDEGGVCPRVPPRGAAGAELMIVVAMPEQADADRLLSGEQGRFLAAILQALGLGEDQVYLASALPRHTPVPDADQLRAAGLGDVLEHHVRLAAPRRLLAFGRLVPPLLGHDMAQDSAPIRIFNHEGLRVPVMAAAGLDRLLRSAAARESFWRRWLDWTDG